MRRSAFASSRAVCLVVVFWLTILSLIVPAPRAGASGPEPAPQGGPGTPSSVPLSFSPLAEVRQSGPRYEAQATTGRFTFDRTGYTLLADTSASTALPDTIGPGRQPGAVRMQFEGATHATLVPEQPLIGLTGDLSAPDARSWRIAAPAYGMLTYRQLYAGIDLQYEGLPGRFKGTYLIAPEVDPRSIRWRFTGATSVEISRETGELWVELPGYPATYLIEGAPLVWQEAASHKVLVPASYQINGDGTISYALGAYDPARPLVIDPVVGVQVMP
jgi:hypothetical protein